MSSDSPLTPRLQNDAKPAEVPDLVSHLRSIITQQRQTIAEQQTELSELRQHTGGMAHRPTPPLHRAPATSIAKPPPEPSRGGAIARSSPRPLARAVAEANFTVVFDGGSLGNPGRGYGSYQIVTADGVVSGERLEYGDRVTNNQAEYLTLIAALEDLRDRLGKTASTVHVAIRGDSRLVIEQVNGRWKVKHPDLQPLRAQVVELLHGFERADIQWHRRDESVRVLGH